MCEGWWWEIAQQGPAERIWEAGGAPGKALAPTQTRFPLCSQLWDPACATVHLTSCPLDGVADFTWSDNGLGGQWGPWCLIAWPVVVPICGVCEKGGVESLGLSGPSQCGPLTAHACVLLCQLLKWFARHHGAVFGCKR